MDMKISGLLMILHLKINGVLIVNGGYINITNVEDIYSISERDFVDTYKFVDEYLYINSKNYC